jgi:hypothetical protein
MSEAVFAPWTPEQIASLNACQRFGNSPPFTCGAPMERDEECGEILYATPLGWICPQCSNWQQDWAYPYMVNWGWVFGLPENVSALLAIQARAHARGRKAGLSGALEIAVAVACEPKPNGGLCARAAHREWAAAAETIAEEIREAIHQIDARPA